MMNDNVAFESEAMESTGTQPMMTQSHELPQVNEFLLEVADVVNSTLDLDTLLQRVAELVRRVIDYEIFAILLLNSKTQELRVRFQIGHPPESERLRLKVGEGITGLAVQRRQPVLVNDVVKDPQYVSYVSGVRSELAIPLIVKNRVIGVIDLEAPQPGYFTEEHQRFLELVGSRIAIAIENARLFTQATRQAKSLYLLNGISRELTSILNLDQLLKRVGDLVSQVVDYQMFSILLLDPSGSKLVHRFSIRFNEAIQIKQDVPMGKGLVGYSAQHKEPVLVPDVCKDERYIELNPETRSELVVPLIYQGRVIGVLDIEHTRVRYFTDEHVRTISTLAAQIAIAIENARLYERIAAQERRLQKDMDLARELQFRLLPHCCPSLPTAGVAARFAPARSIGGDLYDFVHYSPHPLTGEDGKLGIAIGDVSGKGAPAALYAALSSGILRSLAAEHPTPADMLTRINASLSERPVDGQFISMIYGVWDGNARTLRIANSGLPRPIYCRNGKVERIDAMGLPMGMFDHADYDEVTYHASPGDVFVFFSDGILDAQNSAGEMFGRTRLEKVVAQNCGKSANELVDAIFRASSKHAAGEEAFDDRTVVAMKVK